MNNLIESFEQQREAGFEIMGPIEEMYFGGLCQVFNGAEIKLFKCVDPNSFMYVRECVRENCIANYKRCGAFIVSGTDRGQKQLLVTEHVFLNYCKYFNHIVPEYEVYNLIN